MDPTLRELKTRLAEIQDLNAAAAVLSWDQATYMPPGGAAARGRQMATLGRLAHEKLTAATVGRLLEDLTDYEASRPYDDEDASLIRHTRREFERGQRVPADFVAAMRLHGATSFQAWTRARAANDFAAMQPYLEKTLEFSRAYADFFPGYEHVADPLIDISDYGLKTADIQRIFGELRGRLLPLVDAVTAQPPAEDGFLRRLYPESAQLAFGNEVVTRFGYDFHRGRQDKTFHPFMTRFSNGDVRITYRVNTHNVGEALFNTMHEAGHALYEQGVASALEGTPLARGTSAGVHESQSRLWENVIGRSRPFWQFFYPRLQQVFPEQLGEVSRERFYRAINRVERSLIRTEADELTYNLHVMLRFDLELALLEGRLAVRDLPEAWNARMASDLGCTPPDDRDGVLQDVHWYHGRIGGGFQGYTLGNILSVQFYAAATAAHPQIAAETGSGCFETLRGWLTEHIYRHGKKFTAGEVITRATGGPLTIDPYMAYLQTKYGELARD